MDTSTPLYRPDLAAVHEAAFGFHAENCAAGVLDLLAPVRERGGLVLEVGCGTGLLTRALVAAGHRVIASDASPAMLDIARTAVPGAEDIRRIALPDDPLPTVDAVVGIGHPLNYLSDTGAVRRSLVALAGALRPGGVLAIDLCDLAWNEAYVGASAKGRVADDWAMVNRFEVSPPDRFAFLLTVFTREDGGSWRRDDERHDLVLMDTSTVPALLREHGVEASVGTSFGTERLPHGLTTVVGHRGVSTTDD